MTQTNNLIQNLLVIDSQVSDWQSLAAGAGADTALLILDSGADGLTQISDYLSNASAQGLSLLQSIQIISHGSAGSLLLGSSTITKSNLSLYTKQLAKIGSSLTDTGDILLFGCNVAAGQVGLDFINQFAALTNADVAASNDITGSAALNGDWQLEVNTGAIEALTVISPSSVTNYAGILAVPLPTVSVSADLMPVEGGAAGVYTITLDYAAPINGLTVYYTLSGSASLNTDFTITAGTNISAVTTGSFTIAPGQTTATLAINAISDGLIDPNETIKLNLNSDVGYHTTSYFELSFDSFIGPYPYSVSTGDFNGDGKVDLVAVNLQGGASVFLRNAANTGFEPKVDLATGSYPYSVNVGDFNGDGKTDITVANYLSNTVSVLLRNTANTGFDPKIDFATGTAPDSVSVGDFNGDGRVDLAVANMTDNTVSVLLRNTANTGFDPKEDFVTGLHPYSVSAADFNGDGKVDLAVANANSNTVSVLLRNSANTGFDPKVDFVTGTSPTSVSVGDFNGDGKIDLAVANSSSNTVSVLLRNSANTGFDSKIDFETGIQPMSVSVGDFNGDGKLDLALANIASSSVSILLRNATNTGFDPATNISAGSLTIAVSPADFNGDGKLDLAVANSNGNVSVLQNNIILSSTLVIADHNPPNIAPAMSAFAAPVTTGNEDTQITISFADLMAQSNVIDVDGSITGFVIKAVSGGSLIIATAAEMASPLEVALPWNALTNNTVDATHQAYWIPNFNANGSLNAFTTVAKDNGGFESTAPVQVQVTATPVNDLPTGTVTITGTVTQNQILTAHNTLADIDGLSGINYQWLANDIAINDANGTTLTLTQAQVGKAITVKASYIDLQNTAESVTSFATVAVVNANDVPTGAVNITGIATQNQVLSASNTLADVDGLGSITYSWFADGNVITDATGSILALTQAQVGKAITVKAGYTDLQGTVESVTSAATATVSNVNDQPNGAVTISGIASPNQLLSVSNTLSDLDGLGVFNYQWLADGLAIDGAISSTLLLGQTQLGKGITVQVSYTDQLGAQESVASNLINVNDPPSGFVTITGNATQNQVLNASHTLVDTDGLGAIGYQWFANDTFINGATTSTLTLVQAQVGKTITVKASYTDLLGTLESVSSLATSPVVNVNDVPTGGVFIEGTTTQNKILTATNTLADSDGLGTINYAWYANSEIITGARLATLTLGQAQIGKTITVNASYTDLQGTAESMLSSATNVVIAADLSAPIVTSFNPTDGSIAVTVNRNISLSFNEDIQRGSGTIAIHAGSATGAIVENFDAANSNRLAFTGSTLTIDPSNYLAYNTHYFVTFETGCITDIAGNPFVGSSTYDFTTKNLPNYTTLNLLPDLTQSAMQAAPVLIFKPYTDVSVNGWDNQAIYSTLEPYALFNSTFAWTGIEGATYDIFSLSYFDPFLIEVYDMFGNVVVVDTELTYDIYGIDQIFDFVAPYTGTYYVSAGWDQGTYDTFVMLSINEDLNTVPLVDTNAPTVTSFNPTDGAIAVAVATNIGLTFSEAIQKGTGKIIIHSGSTDGAIVDSFDAATSNLLSIIGNTLTINPLANLANNTQYFVTFDAGSVKDLAGNSYAGTTTYDFTTAVATNVTNGTVGNDKLVGTNASDILNGGKGADSMKGGLGNDTYYVDNTGDAVIENKSAGTDTVYSSISFILGPNLENLNLTGKAAISGTGNALNNTLTGNVGINKLIGGAGADKLIGGLSNDILTGGAAKDIFRFEDRSKDTIKDFSVKDDTIQLENSSFTKLAKLGVLNAANFKIGAGAADSNDFIVYNSKTGALFYDDNGNEAGHSTQIAIIGTHLALTNADFVIT